jgi:hypothetical protein
MDPGGRRPCDRWLVKPHATFWDRDVPRRTAHSTRLWPGDFHAGPRTARRWGHDAAYPVCWLPETSRGTR